MRKRLLVLISALLLLTACQSFGYYSQAINGHLSLFSKRRSIDEVLRDEPISEKLRERLKLALEVVDFAREEMSLPDNGSYRHFVKVDGPYVVWNVIATPPYSLKPKQWCYPIAGCANYRGYYDKARAERYAGQLEAEGLDVAVSGSSAYSTLGWFSDPLLSTMLYKDEGRFVEVIIHELAHQRLYIKDHTQLNESFAEVVAQEGVKRWFKRHGDDAAYRGFLADQRLQEDFTQLLLSTRAELERLYKSAKPEEEMARDKAEIFDRLRSKYRQFKQVHDDNRYDAWMSRPLNNADLSLIATYHDLQPMLTKMLQESGGDMEQFYARVEEYAEHLEQGDGST